MGMMLGDFVTALKYEWPITVVVLNNQKLGMIKFEQEVNGMPEFATDLYNPDFAAYARACGGQGYRVDRPADLQEALLAALAASTSAIVDVLVDPNVKPMPPRITFDQARGYAQAMFREALHV
jgi:pyruvate oxidase